MPINQPTNQPRNQPAGPHEIVRELELDNPADEVWQLLRDPDELAGWVGDEVRGARIAGDDLARRMTWTWEPDGIASTVEVTLTEVGDRTHVRVVERVPGATASARTCAVRRWDDALLTLELKALTWTNRLVRV